MSKQKKKGRPPQTSPNTKKKNRQTILLGVVSCILAVVMVASLIIPFLDIVPSDQHDHDTDTAPYFMDGYWYVFNEDHGHYEGYPGTEDNAPYEEDGVWYVYDDEHGHYHSVDEAENNVHTTAAGRGGSAASLSATEFTGPVKYVDRGISPTTISQSLTLEQRVDVDTAYRFFIYLMDKEGYTPNAIIGVMTYMMAEGGSYSDIMQGTYTYQTDWIYPGPSGVVMDKLEDNAAWIRWLNGEGFDRAVYTNGNCNIGLGLTQESDVWWYSRDNKTTANATALIQAAMAAGVPWQDPAFQVNYIIQNKLSLPWAWDINDVPGVDPKLSVEVSALEWATRVWCGVGMPAYSSLTAPELFPDGYASHVRGLSRAAELYEQYTGTDPWFYKPEADWHNPFAGPVVYDTTDAGLLLARTAVFLSSNSKVFLEGEHSYDAQELKREASLQYYRRASHSIGKTVTATGDYAATADIAVSTVVLLSGVDDNFQRLYPGSQRKYMLHSSKWDLLGTVSEVELQPGDILVKLSPSDPDGVEEDTARHIMVYVSERVAQERWKDTDWNVFDASLATAGTPNAYYPCMSHKGFSELGDYQVFRCNTQKRDFSGSYWNKFVLEYGSLFPEIPLSYQPNFFL